MSYKLLLVGATLANAMALSVSGASAITVETTNFISSPTYFNGFEGVAGNVPVFLPGPTPKTVSYSEGGITVSASGISFGALEPVGSYDYWNGVGQSQWYAPLYGYSDIRLTSGGNFQSLQFLASSGFRGITTTFIAYQVLELSSVIAFGTLAIDAFCCDVGAGWQFVGFSGGGFDEVRVQAYSTADSAQFNAANFQAIALDNVAAVPQVPLPPSIVLQATGLGLLGLLGWRRKRKGASLCGAIVKDFGPQGTLAAGSLAEK
jgi:hypothetical protein